MPPSTLPGGTLPRPNGSMKTTRRTAWSSSFGYGDVCHVKVATGGAGTYTVSVSLQNEGDTTPRVLSFDVSKENRQGLINFLKDVADSIETDARTPSEPGSGDPF